MRERASFTLIELLVVIAILAVLSVTVVFVLNPSDLIKQSKDSTRLTDLQTLNKALAFFDVTNPDDFTGTSTVIYVSIPDTTTTCANLGLPTMPSSYSYHCVSTSTLALNNGSGWIPVNFTAISYGSPISRLPTDPVNATSTGEYYSYIPGGSYKLTAHLTSEKYASKETLDNGLDPSLFEIGSNLSLAPFSGGLLGYWPLDEGGTSANDYSGYNDNGVMYSSTTIADLHTSPTNCKKGGCASFDGIDDYATVADTNDVLDKMKSFTICFWAKPVSGNSQGVYNKNLSYEMFSSGSHDIYFYDRKSDNTIFSLHTGAVFSDNTWIHICNTIDASSNKFYKNGVLNVSANTSGFDYLNNTANNFEFGRNSRAGTYFGGVIDELYIFKKVLSDAEIQALYNSSL